MKKPNTPRESRVNQRKYSFVNGCRRQEAKVPANITLAAWAKGVGSCIMGAINKPALSELLGIAAPDKLAFMVALGCPTHAAKVVPMTEKTGIKYYLDENGDYCVPKRSVEELARSV